MLGRYFHIFICTTMNTTSNIKNAHLRVQVFTLIVLKQKLVIVRLIKNNNNKHREINQSTNGKCVVCIYIYTV